MLYGDTCGFIFSQGKNFNILYCEEQLKLWNIIRTNAHHKSKFIIMNRQI